jgi:glycosyl transferase family 25
MDRIEKIVYINLDHRTDRRSEIEGELARIGLSGERFSAVLAKPGYIGCLQSHLNVLELAKQSGWKNVLLLEDDFQFIVDRATFEQELTNFFQLEIPYDVLMIGYNLLEKKPLNDTVCRATNVQTTSGYLVHERFYDALIANWKQALPLLIQTDKHWLYSCDQSWKILQPVSEWFCLNRRIGIQRSSFSDIANRVVFYGDC